MNLEPTKINPLFLSGGVLSVLLILSGCSASVAKPTPPQPNQELQELTKAANEVSSQLNELIRLERGELVETRTAKDENGLKKVITVKWSGSGENLAKGIAEHIGFSFKVSGNTPQTSIIVPLDFKDRTAEDVLRTVANRLEGVAAIKVSENKKQIEVAYH